jgi:membrane carboxypeptidase/penicillin-binding protein PbpC
VAGKTGTTSSSRDRWFCGYTSNYTAAVWCGYDTPAKINLSFNPAARLFKNVMQPLHKGLTNKKLYSLGSMTTVTVCLDSGKLATDACKSDIRGDRTEKVYVYAEDRPKTNCDQHVVVDICSVGGAVANEYCAKFAEVDSNVKLVKNSLLKLTKNDISKITAAERYNLDEIYYQDNYVYLVDENGKDLSFKGFDGKINKGVTAPYKVCTVHTEESWDKEHNSGGIFDSWWN